MLAKSFYGVRYSLIVVCIALLLEGIAARVHHGISASPTDANGSTSDPCHFEGIFRI